MTLETKGRSKSAVARDYFRERARLIVQQRGFTVWEFEGSYLQLCGSTWRIYHGPTGTIEAGLYASDDHGRGPRYVFTRGVRRLLQLHGVLPVTDSEKKSVDTR